MPQFDFTTYSGQIFWFSICFFVLYFFMAKIILPRIKSIIDNRKNVVDDDIFSAQNFDMKSNSIKVKTSEILLSADIKYKTAIEDVAKEAAKQKEKSLQNFKNKADEMLAKSQNEIQKVIDKASKESQVQAQQISTLIQDKIFN